VLKTMINVLIATFCHGIVLLLPMYHYIYHFLALRPPSSINIHTFTHRAYYCRDTFVWNLWSDSDVQSSIVESCSAKRITVSQIVHRSQKTHSLGPVELTWMRFVSEPVFQFNDQI
jgi:hypothetical protein